MIIRDNVISRWDIYTKCAARIRAFMIAKINQSIINTSSIDEIMRAASHTCLAIKDTP